ncbi:hypothetical protein [Polaribacter sp. 11A2H]|uniref:hypothetical protein n=1 Tax=Polaribacter sp. 11A2H TaxID=2687290 RepID=UPI00140AFB34|nr:hypothetical protein [Polaribacter sp. 11A2H]
MAGYREASIAIEHILNTNKEELTNKTEDFLSKYIKELNLAIEEFETIKRYAFRDHTRQNSDFKILKIKSKIKEIEEIKDYKRVEIVEDNKPNLKHPFTNNETFKLFEFIVKKWNYSYNQKWADIWNELSFSDKYKAPFKNDYQAFIIKSYGYTGKFQYDKLKDTNNKNKKELIKIIEEFDKNRPI